ncbi:MAG: FAD:protein FMN transferase [Bryobacteraceae bacterium]
MMKTDAGRGQAPVSQGAYTSPYLVTEARRRVDRASLSPDQQHLFSEHSAREQADATSGHEIPMTLRSPVSALRVVLLLAVPATPHTPALQPFEMVEPHMGTLFRIKLYASSQLQAVAGFQAAFTRIHQLDQTLSDYNPTSELMQLCGRPPGQPVHVSFDLYRVLEASQELSRASGGAFDVTEATVIRLWREARRTKQLPNASALQEAGEHSGFSKLTLDAVHHTVTLAQPGMLLDLGGIAKGYAADEALVALRAQGIRSAMVAASGDIAVSDAPPDRPGWQIGVDSVDLPQATFTRILVVSNAAVSTSGDTEQFVDINGQRYSHIIDPKTHQALTRRITVTVAAHSGIDADSLATALCVLGPERGLELLKHYPGAEALFFAADAEPHILESSGFHNYF